MRSQFVTSADAPEAFPPNDRPEFAFFGRSNVGKSTLLNRLAGAKIARVSRTPGRTQRVNFFDVEGRGVRCRFADLPGYGYAAAPKTVVRTFEPIVLRYLHARQLRAALLLVDVRRGLRDEDRSVWEMLEQTVGSEGAELWPVLTKVDKVAKAKRKPEALALARALGVPPDRVALTSDQDAATFEALAARIAARAPES